MCAYLYTHHSGFPGRQEKNSRERFRVNRLSLRQDVPRPLASHLPGVELAVADGSRDRTPHCLTERLLSSASRLLSLSCESSHRSRIFRMHGGLSVDDL